MLTPPNEISEFEYDLSVEANIATLFTTGNGYTVVRGCLEKFECVRI